MTGWTPPADEPPEPPGVLRCPHCGRREPCRHCDTVEYEIADRYEREDHQ